MDIAQIAELGGVVVLAVIIFTMYRKDRASSQKQIREDRKYMEDRLTKMIEADQVTRKENTEVQKELITYLKLRNGKG